ncbi:uncharacterized protein LOC114337971 [Diabrotica virgifera virgifera]|uniref:Serpin domain-containing protein n=1 Tax=Diabrotica virgifera virgifera TaxID=50390 RepID=A0ABM5KXQ1_DIAVI|nr:uncharacterized protein LOC114337971 [Diabrotica virgifera virgifera]
MARLTPAIILLSLSTLVAAQLDSSIHFPGDSSFPASSLQQAVGSPYENYVDLVIARGINKLCLEINQKYQETNGLIKVDNTVFSPINIAGALALLLLGSNGQTFKELATVLGLATGLDIENNSERVHEHLGQILRRIEERPYSVGEDEQQINFANAIFVQESFPIRKIYKETADSLYKFEIFNLNFEREPVKAQKYVNAWVSDRTVGKIKDILSEPPLPSTKIILASAMYFKAKWEIPFLGEGVTQRRPFYPNGRRSPSEFQVELMTVDGEFPYFEDTELGCQIVGLPYKGRSTVLYLIMPFESSAQKLKQFEDKITVADLESLAQKTAYKNATISIPKMTLDSTLDVKSILSNLNVRHLFDESANLGLLSPGIENSRGLLLPQQEYVLNPLTPDESHHDDDIIIYSRSGKPVNCSNIFDISNNITTCEEIGEHYKGEHKRNKRVSSFYSETIDSLRHIINQQSGDNNGRNPRLYVDKIFHKVYMQVTESGTEAAAATATFTFWSKPEVSFRADVPFIFFMRHEATKTIMFWGSVEKPTPYFNTGSVRIFRHFIDDALKDGFGMNFIFILGRPFYPNGRKSPSEFEVELMGNAGEFPYLKDHKLGCEILGLPYKGNKTVFYVVMPFESSVEKLKEFQNRITEADLESLADRTVYRKALVSFPKMTVESTLDMNSILTKLNVINLFDPESAQLGLISPGVATIRRILSGQSEYDEFVKNSLTPSSSNPDDVIIFDKSGNPVNCSSIFDKTNNITTCKEIEEDSKKANKRINRIISNDGGNIDTLRHLLDRQSGDSNNQNPGLYADRIIHKISLQITEEGTEAAATTAILIVKSYARVKFRVDVPFIFFVRHEETKTILFWGSVETPTPCFNTGLLIQETTGHETNHFSPHVLESANGYLSAFQRLKRHSEYTAALQTLRRFYPNGRKSPSEFDVESMSNAGEFPYLKDTRLGCEILGLPYKGNKTVFYIIMPFESSVQKLKDFQNRIREADLESLADRTVYRKALVSFPKMTVESTLDLNPILTKLNVRSLFDPESAQLGLISPTTANIRTTQLRPVPQGTAQLNPLRPFPSNPNNVIIFNRSGQPGNCSNTFGNTNNTTPCKDRMEDTKGEAKVINKTGDKIGSRVARNISNRKTKRTIMRSGENIDNLRHLLDQQPAYNSYQNPGLYADRIIHKIFLQITEEGTEAAATTAVLLIKSYSRVEITSERNIKTDTTRRPFYPNGRKSPSEFEVEMMAVGAEFPYFRDSKLGCEILGLPYKGNKTVFYIIMPFDSSVQKLKEFEDRITEMDLETLAEKAIYKKALVSFPKMTLESTLNMKSVLAKLNITNLFNPVTANLGLISAGPGNIPFKRNPHEKSEINPLTPNQDPDDVIIFNKSGNPVNCSGIFDNSTNITTCEETVVDAKGEHKVIYKKFGDKIGRRIEKSMSNEKPIKNSRKPFSDSRDTIDNLRHLINKQSADNNYLNPGLYADKVIHKVFLQVTEAGTEAAATTIVALPRSYSSIGFRVDVPFIFFMRHESTKTILFWGSVEKPTPYFKTSS